MQNKKNLPTSYNLTKRNRVTRISIRNENLIKYRNNRFHFSMKT